MRSMDDFPTFLLVNKLLEMQHRNATFLTIFSKSHAFYCMSNYLLARKM